MKITLNLTTNIYGPPDIDTGKQKLLKRDIRFKKTFNSEQIDVSHYITSKGKIAKHLSIVIHEGKEYIVRSSFDDLERMIKPIEIIGYKKWK